jgi:hypothetical protein
MSHLNVPEVLTPGARQKIIEKYGADLVEKRGQTAEQRLIASYAVASYFDELLAEGTNRKADSVLSTALSVAAECVERTTGKGSDKEIRLIRAGGRLLCQAVILHANICDAAKNKRIKRGQAKLLKKAIKRTTADSIEAFHDSQVMFMGDAKDQEFARRILGKARGDLKTLEHSLVNHERQNLRKKHSKHRKQRKEP